MEILTERLLLREMTAADYPALYTVLADSDIMRHYPYTFDEARVRRWIDVNLDRYRTFGFGLWAVTLRETGEMIGDCGLTIQRIHGRFCPEIGYHIARAYQGQGYATESARAVRDWTFANTPFGAVYSYMTADNEPSRRTAMAVGMRFVEEYTEDGETNAVYALTRTEWVAKTTATAFQNS